jgi:uncharacterized membrane protein (DUF485 family)|tara:strand:- start:6515 stop:6856 length:342 start_codon:yes stop_codon:yes gene_type:complete
MFYTKKGSRMKDELVERIENNPKYQELVSKRTSFGIKLGVFVLVMFYAFILTIAFNKEVLATKIGDGLTTVAFPIALAILVISFITTLIYVKRANGEFEDLTNEIKKDVKDLI